MKVFTTVVEKNGKSKKIFVKVNDEIAAAVEKMDEKFRHEYIVGKHEMYLNELKETRRHVSYEKCCEKGEIFFSEDPSLEDQVIQADEYKKLYKSLDSLTPQQYWIIVEIFFNKTKKTVIAQKLGITKQAVEYRLSTIFKKLRKNFENLT